MIQVCSSCGTRWNVRDKQRVWCPRCQGSLLPPTANAPAPDPGWNRPPAGAPAAPGRAPGPQRLPAGFRWIAVRPGAAPAPRRRQRPLGPTPRYDVIPRWSLGDHLGYHALPPAPVRSGPTPATVRATLLATAVILAGAAVVYLARYVLLVINRTTLLHPFVAGAAVWLGMLATAGAFIAVIVCWVVLSNWLIARRAAVYAHLGRSDPRSPLEQWVGCLVPVVNLLWAPVYVIDMARVDEVYTRLRKPIVVWWLLWVLSTAASLFAVATSSIAKAAFNVVFGTNVEMTAQGIADNHVAMVVAYLIATAAVLAVARVYRGFESKPVQRPAHHWIVVARDESAPAVEPLGQEPAA